MKADSELKAWLKLEIKASKAFKNPHPRRDTCMVCRMHTLKEVLEKLEK